MAYIVFFLCWKEVKVHSAMKGSQVVWLGDSDMHVSAGFSTMRNAELALWDLSNMSKPLTKITLDSSTGYAYTACSSEYAYEF